MQIGMQPLTHQHQTAGVSDEDKNALLISSNRLLPRIPPRIIQDQVSVFTRRYEEYDQVRVTKAAVAILIEQKKTWGSCVIHVLPHKIQQAGPSKWC